MQVSCFLHYDKNDSGKSRSLRCFGLEEAMKIDRLIGILSILLQKDTVTAPELAERFEVSRRTIGRDIDALCRAGIPILTRQGISPCSSICPPGIRTLWHPKSS